MFGLAVRRDIQNDLEAVHMVRYIEEKLEEKRAAQRPQDAAAGAGGARGGPAGPRSEQELEAELYAVPEHLQGMEKRELNSESQGWLVGITEVKLDKTFKLKNIEETEEAKKKLLEAAITGQDTHREEGPILTHDRFRLPRTYGQWVMDACMPQAAWAWHPALNSPFSFPGIPPRALPGPPSPDAAAGTEGPRTTTWPRPSRGT